MEYNLIIADKNDLVKEVNSMIAEGWEPIGGVAMSTSNTKTAHPLTGNEIVSTILYQAMIKK